jgi:hypothetical protein
MELAAGWDPGMCVAKMCSQAFTSRHSFCNRPFIWRARRLAGCKCNCLVAPACYNAQCAACMSPPRAVQVTWTLADQTAYRRSKELPCTQLHASQACSGSVVIRGATLSVLHIRDSRSQRVSASAGANHLRCVANSTPRSVCMEPIAQLPDSCQPEPTTQGRPDTLPPASVTIHAAHA